ncbi:MAG: YggS family pyridoxal phosphate-dependent enzyme [Microbacteriaceae bacterium]|nr:YggS family pyridoxal phosphate-dependent enzyme [Microbacteriaceae bacterium]
MLSDRLDAIRSELPGGVTLIVVTKFHPVGLVRELHALGVRDFGESRHQEAGPKAAEFADLDLDWHFIGQLQSNKAKAVRAYASAVHSLDRPSLLGALADPDATAPLGVFIQVNLTEDPGRGGVRPGDLAGFAERAVATPGVRLAGLMAVAGLGEDPAREFARVRELRDRVLLPVAPEATALSMGMSGDWREAVREGATHLRIGTAITGNRPDPAYSRP